MEHEDMDKKNITKVLLDCENMVTTYDLISKVQWGEIELQEVSNAVA